jgi:hypothetical protein
MKAPSTPRGTFNQFLPATFFLKKPNCPGKADNGLAPTTIKILLNKECHFLPQKSLNDSENIGFLDNLGHASFLNLSGLMIEKGPFEGRTIRVVDVKMQDSRVSKE